MKLEQLVMPGDFPQATREAQCYGECVNKSIELFAKGEFKRSAVYMECAERSALELQDMIERHDDFHKVHQEYKNAKDEYERQMAVDMIRHNLNSHDYRV